METVNQVLKVLFQEVRCEDVIDRLLDNSGKYQNYAVLVDEGSFTRQLLHVDVAKTLDHADIVYHVLRDEWSRPHRNDYELMYSKDANLFNILLHFSRNKIYVHHNTPICKYSELLSWHEVTRDFGEDMFVTSYLAARDLKSGMVTSKFDWNCYIGSDARELNELFKKDMYDVHAHLYGSSLNFEINWLCLMNILQGHEKCFSLFDKAKVYPSMTYKLDTNTRPLYVKVLYAAVIRLYLYLAVVSEDWSNALMMKLQVMEMLKCKSLLEVLYYANIAQEYIEAIGFSKARKYVDRERLTSFIPDYAIVGDDEGLLSVLGGERHLMYHLFRKIYSGEYGTDKKVALFYIYLLIKEELRKEMVQVNYSLGFGNFADYQSRKSKFIPEGSVYDRLLSQLAVGSFIQSARHKRYMELRIAPQNTARQDIKQMLWNDNCITKRIFAKEHCINLHDFYYIYHFIKLKDGGIKGDYQLCEFSLLPRHDKQRRCIEQQAKAIKQLMQSGHGMASRLVGIDAANSEIYCRPEVFSQVYRYLALPLHDDKGKVINRNLGMTFHVGEDFYDVVDGLRAVDEVLAYLHFGNGTRLGHALVLGIDACRYYMRHNYRVNATKQVLLDNAAWLYVQAQRMGISNSLLSYIKEVYCNYYHQVYQDEAQLADVFSYYQSWLLRGDSPDCYLPKGNMVSIDMSDEVIDDWNRVAYNRGVEVDEAHCNPEAKKLYYLYHFNLRVRRNGADSVVFKIKPEYREAFVEMIEKLQQRMLSEIERLHIAIECNPSSNFKIGEICRYDEHPIFKFNNHGLSSPYPHHSINVSINTDDAGIFSTSLEREYSLIALALEKHEDNEHVNTPREVMDWLGRIRLMTKEQIFKPDF